MDGSPILLDTNAASALFRKDRALRNVLLGHSGLALPVIVLGELLYGAKGSSRRRETEQDIQELARICEVMFIDADVASHYAALKYNLRTQGRLIPDNDLWIAAIAMRHGLPLLSNDSHFKVVDGLNLKIW